MKPEPHTEHPSTLFELTGRASGGVIHDGRLMICDWRDFGVNQVPEIGSNGLALRYRDVRINRARKIERANPWSNLAFDNKDKYDDFLESFLAGNYTAWEITDNITVITPNDWR